ncbi:MAG: twin transmembrane helix small protein [Acidiferrobacterales bacterium]
MAMLKITAILAMLVTIGMLAMGIGSMAHGGSFDQKHSGQWMTARVVAQAVAFTLVLVAIYLAVAG